MKTDTQTEQTVKKPMYGSSRLHMRAHGVRLCIWLPLVDPAYRAILEHGYFSDNKRILCQTEQQAIDISKGHVDTYELEDPAPTTYEPTDAAKNAAAQAGGTTFTDELKARFNPNDVMYRLKLSAMADTICSTFEDPESAEDLAQGIQRTGSGHATRILHEIENDHGESLWCHGDRTA